MCKLQIMFLLYIVNRLRLKFYFEIKLSKLIQYYISFKRLSRVGRPENIFRDTGTRSPKPVTIPVSGTYGKPNNIAKYIKNHKVNESKT
jgi:hypothetical protein